MYWGLVLFLGSTLLLIHIVDKLKDVMQVYDFRMDRVKGIVHDQASNMDLTGQSLGENCNTESLNCATHRLQLCINEGLELSIIARPIATNKKTRSSLST